MAGGDLLEIRHAFGAFVARVRAAGAEGAAARRVQRARDIAGEHDALEGAGDLRILDRDSGRILDAECNIILGINSDYIASLLVGRNFYQELDEIILSIQQQYFGPGQRALIVCLKDAYSKMRARSPRSLPLRK